MTCREDGEAENEDPCDGKARRKCNEIETCTFYKKECVNKEEKDRKNLYVKYEWQYMYEDGDATKDEFCYAKQIDSVASYGEACAAIKSNKDCRNFGCKYNKKKGCLGQKTQVNCNRVKLSKEACESLSVLGCSYEMKKNGKGKCSGGKVNLPKE